MKRTLPIKRLSLIAETLGYKVVFRRINDMRQGELGITCPEVSRIYIDPQGSKDIVSTLAHEIGHVLLLCCSTPGHNMYEDTDFDLQVAENAADEIGAVLCRAIGCGNDFSTLQEKAKFSTKEAQSKYKNNEEYKAFLFGYCKALADSLPSSEVGINDLIAQVSDAFESKDNYFRSRFPTLGRKIKGRSKNGRKI